MQTWNKARSLAGLGHAVHVLSCASGAGPDLGTYNEDGVIVHRMRPPGLDFPVYGTAAYWVGYSWSVFRHLHGLMQATRFDVLDFPDYGAEGFAYLLDRTPWSWTPVVVQLHGPLAMFVEHIGWPEKGSELHRVGGCMEELCLRSADALMACSGAIADFAAGHYGLGRESIDVVHCSVDTEAFRPGDERGRESRPTVLFVGNVAINKGVQTVMDAVLTLRSKYPSIRLQILGTGDDELVDELQSSARAMGASAAVEFHGYVDRARLPDFYRRAHVFCSPSQYEALGIVYLEAMACGCPVVASSTGGTPEAIRDGRTGFLVPPDNPDAVTAAVDRLLGDGPLRQAMAAAGRRHVEDHFGMSAHIQRVLATYEKAVFRSQETLNRLIGEGNTPP